jgi:hypothetical protein
MSAKYQVTLLSLLTISLIVNYPFKLSVFGPYTYICTYTYRMLIKLSTTP